MKNTNCFIVFIWIGGIVIYVWTIAIAFTSGGFGAGAVSAFLPLLSTLYWFLVYGFNVTFLTLYHVCVVLYAVVTIGLAVVGALRNENA